VLGLPVVDPPYPTAVGLVAVAADALRSGREPEPLVPLYLRRPDATEPGTRKLVTAPDRRRGTGPPDRPAGDLEIRPLQQADLPRCAELERQLFRGDDPWRAEAFAAELDLGYFYRAAWLGGTLVGYAGLALLGRPPYLEAEVHTIGVDPARQRHGIGRRLLRELLAHADEHGAATYLEVRTDNTSAIELYRSQGFEVLGTRRRYYRPSGADAYTMRRTSPQPAPATTPATKSEPAAAGKGEGKGKGKGGPR
jgi:ribosomal-protein-alanine N-acetyltransferase